MKLTNFDERARTQCYHGVKRLWDAIQTQPSDSIDYQNAYKKLTEVTVNIRLSLKKQREEQAAKAAHTTQASQATQGSHINQEAHSTEAAPQAPQEAQQNGSAPSHQGQQTSLPTTAPPSQGVEQFSPKVLQTVQSQSFIVPPYISQQGPEPSQIWLREARLKYARHLQKLEISKAGLFEMTKTVNGRQKEGRSFSSEETAQLNNRKNRLFQTVQEAEDYITKFRTHQAALKSGMSAQSNQESNQDPVAETQNVEQGQVVVAPQPLQQRTDNQGQAHTVSSALDAARNQLSSGGQGAGSPLSAGQNASQQLGHPSMNSGKIGQGQANMAHPSHPHVNQAITAATVPVPPPANPQPNSTPQSATSQRPHPLSHSAAMAQTAQIYAQPNYQPPTAQPSTHAHPPLGNRENIGHRDSQTPSNLKFHIPKELKVSPPMPIPMGPARPTLTGGPNNGATTSLSQPAIQRHPGYVLEGEGERVLSKKKLEELVRQVTGGGVESEEGETLSAEVEEVRYTAFTCREFISAPAHPDLRFFYKLQMILSTRSSSALAVSPSYVSRQAWNCVTYSSSWNETITFVSPDTHQMNSVRCGRFSPLQAGPRNSAPCRRLK